MCRKRRNDINNKKRKMVLLATTNKEGEEETFLEDITVEKDEFTWLYLHLF